MVKQYLPTFKPVNALNPDKPTTVGAFGMPGIYTEAKMAQNEALIESKPEILKAWKETGRRDRPVLSSRWRPTRPRAPKPFF